MSYFHKVSRLALQLYGATPEDNSGYLCTAAPFCLHGHLNHAFLFGQNETVLTSDKINSYLKITHIYVHLKKHLFSSYVFRQTTAIQACFCTVPKNAIQLYTVKMEMCLRNSFQDGMLLDNILQLLSYISFNLSKET